VVSEHEGTWAKAMKVQDRCRYIGGDMFVDVPPANAYSLKMILHDWSDDECVTILKHLRRRATGAGRVFIVEHVVPSMNARHFSKLYDIHMMCWGSGRERTESEYGRLLAAAGWKATTTVYPENAQMGVVVGVRGDLNG